MSDDEGTRDRVNAWQDALRAADLTVRLVGDAVRLEPDGVGADVDGRVIAAIAEQVVTATCEASDRASEAVRRARHQLS